MKRCVEGVLLWFSSKCNQKENIETSPLLDCCICIFRMSNDMLCHLHCLIIHMMHLYDSDIDLSFLKGQNYMVLQALASASPIPCIVTICMHLQLLHQPNKSNCIPISLKHHTQPLTSIHIML